MSMVEANDRTLRIGNLAFKWFQHGVDSLDPTTALSKIPAEAPLWLDRDDVSIFFYEGDALVHIDPVLVVEDGVPTQRGVQLKAMPRKTRWAKVLATNDVAYLFVFGRREKNIAVWQAAEHIVDTISVARAAAA